MARNTTRRTATAGGERRLPRSLSTYTRYALSGLVVGTGLCLLALFTNPVPDPSFPWFSLPASFRLPVTQPRIEHWPVTYSIGIWLWILGFPALFLAGYERLADRSRFGAETWLVGAPTLAMLGWTTYCRVFWPKLTPPTWNAPSYTFVCWLYCSTYDPLWSDLAYVVVAIGAIAAVSAVAFRDSARVVALEVTFGVLALPLGLPALYDAYRRTGA